MALVLLPSALLCAQVTPVCIQGAEWALAASFLTSPRSCIKPIHVSDPQMALGDAFTLSSEPYPSPRCHGILPGQGTSLCLPKAPCQYLQWIGFRVVFVGTFPHSKQLESSLWCLCCPLLQGMRDLRFLPKPRAPCAWPMPATGCYYSATRAALWGLFH